MSNTFPPNTFRDLIPIVAALEYNPWFTKIVARGNKLVSCN